MEPDTESVAEAVAEATAENVEAAVAHAEQRADAAEAVAEQLTEAAIESERVRRIEAIEERVTEWLGQQHAQVDELRQRLDAQQVELSSLRGTQQLSPDQVAMLVMLANQQSTPPLPPTPEPGPVVEAETQEPAAAGDAPAEESREAAPRARRHRFL